MKINNLRRVVQFLVLALFMLGNLEILNILKGNLSSSILLGKISLSDPSVSYTHLTLPTSDLV